MAQRSMHPWIRIQLLRRRTLLTHSTGGRMLRAIKQTFQQEVQQSFTEVRQDIRSLGDRLDSTERKMEGTVQYHHAAEAEILSLQHKEATL
ncbi:hypothetical protein FKM82_008083 [Ascaphus truei]